MAHTVMTYVTYALRGDRMSRACVGFVGSQREKYASEIPLIWTHFIKVRNVSRNLTFPGKPLSFYCASPS